MVRLRAPSFVYALILTFSFNSNMVRLRGIPNLANGLTKLFQFQYGSIKSEKLFMESRNPRKVSIPIWFD